jgi:hypothetical protein
MDRLDRLMAELDGAVARLDERTEQPPVTPSEATLSDATPLEATPANATTSNTASPNTAPSNIAPSNIAPSNSAAESASRDAPRARWYWTVPAAAAPPTPDELAKVTAQP